jgi:histidinol-phosphate aminotransferase
MAQRRTSVSRRSFIGGVAFGSVGLASADLWAQRGGRPGSMGGPAADGSTDSYDALAKLGNNENPWGPSAAVMAAMTNAFKYANRYGYPDGNLAQVLAAHHGVTVDHILLGAGSGEILDVTGTTFLAGGRKVLSVEPTFGAVYQHASGLNADAIKVPLTSDYRQDIDQLIVAAHANASELGFVYLCNPNNPTGVIVTAKEVRDLLDSLPAGLPVLIDEAYHHFVDDPLYATSVPYVKEGRPVIVTRTFSKIAALAGMRLGYAVAPPALIKRMKPNSVGSINALVKWGGVAALKDAETEARVKRDTIALRTKVTNDLAALGFESIPSQGNFFMVHIKRDVVPVVAGFRQRGVVVGRPFPPMTQHLRVSVGTESEMARFMTAFKEVFA